MSRQHAEPSEMCSERLSKLLGGTAPRVQSLLLIPGAARASKLIHHDSPIAVEGATTDGCGSSESGEKGTESAIHSSISYIPHMDAL